jgi:Alpha amylase, catalytic domain
VVVDPSTYDWEGDTPLGRPFTKTIIYEMHVGGFTRHPSSGVTLAKRGTYAGLIDKIPYLRDLGVSAVELLPVFAFDEQDGPPGLGNYWGYQTMSFFAPHYGYSSRSDPLGEVDEFRDMVMGEWKGATILAGSCCEALLLYGLQTRETKVPGSVAKAVAAIAWPGSNSPKAADLLHRSWDLFSYTEAASHLGLITDTTRCELGPARDYRNLILRRPSEKRSDATGEQRSSGLALLNM